MNLHDDEANDETPRRGSLTSRQMVIAFAIIEAAVLVPLVIYLILTR